MFSSTALFKHITCPEISSCSLLNCIFLHHVLPSTQKNPGNAQKSSVLEEAHAGVAQTAMNSRDDSPQDDRPRKKRRIDNDETNVAKYLVGFQSQSPRSKTSGSPSHTFLTRETLQASQAECSPLPGNLSTEGEFALIGKEKTKQASDDTRQISERDKSKTTLKRKSMDPQKKDLSAMRSMFNNSSEAVAPPNKSSVPQAPQEDIEESLNPRMIPNPPASHAIRIRLLALLHQCITKLNDQTKLSNNPSKASLILSPQQLTTAALNIESSIAEESPFVYQNIMKRRIMKYRKMTQEEWDGECVAESFRAGAVAESSRAGAVAESSRTGAVAERSRRRAVADSPKTRAVPSAEPVSAPAIETGLSTTDELAFLPRIYADQAKLSAFAYVTSAPTQQEMDAAVEGVEAAHGWEYCDRCITRFQVFPGRRSQDGLSTAGGRCQWHDRRLKYTSLGQALHSCCNQREGGPACQDMGCHVFKVSDPKRLAAIMPFLETPENAARLCEEAVAFDCEMGYTALGMELIRLTAISWPTGNPLIDVLVRPLGQLFDLNSKFSGVSPAQYAEGTKNVVRGFVNHQPRTSDGVKTLKMMNSPVEARALLYTYISPTTPLIGHALENDLKAMRMIHPCIVDTVDLYPHSRGLPYRNSLKWLAEEVLGRSIQGGSDGHDSHEDARTAGDLVKAKIKNVVKRWKMDGDKFGDGILPPTDWNLKTPLQ